MCQEWDPITRSRQKPLLLNKLKYFVATGEWKRVKPGKLMVEPYRHIFVLHIAIVLGAGLVMAFEGAWPLLALIVLGKLVADLFQIWRGSRRKG